MTDTSTPSPYRVLARKYRPRTFGDLVGQEVMVRTLTNAIRAERLPHAFVLTGVRGVGKTSTARIIAKAMNCTGRGGGPTEDPCGACEHCVAISEDRHVDVLEMDAASHTGVDDVRELIDGARYAPVTGRYKVYIVDEVHMLSRNAFNALLKTLEEPPPHAMFVFATTEVRRIPVTVLSRCMRFDLRRIEAVSLVDHLARICEREAIPIEKGALDVVARAAEGSVRDALSLLDQAATLADGEVSVARVRDMLGLADRAQMYELLERVLRGDVAGALGAFGELVGAGAEPDLVVEDLLALTHWLTRLKVVPDSLDDPTVAETDRAHGERMAADLSMPALTRAWQILLKGLNEVRSAPSPGAAAEMVIVRLGYAANLPPPAEIVRRLTEADGGAAAAAAGDASGAGGRTAAASTASGGNVSAAPASGAAAAAPDLSRESETAPAARRAAEPAGERALPDFEAVVDFVLEMKEPVLAAELRNNVRLVGFEPGRIELRLLDKARPDLPGHLGGLLSEATGRRWVISVSRAEGAPTLNQQAESAERERRIRIERHPLVRKALDTFPGAEIRDVREAEAPPSADAGEMPAAPEEEQDP